MKKKSSFLVFCLLCFSYVSQAQVVVPADSAANTIFLPHQFTLHQFSNGTMKVVPASYYADKLSFFCEKEWKLEKTTGVPFKFRLGSVEQTDYLEGKSNSTKPVSNF